MLRVYSGIPEADALHRTGWDLSNQLDSFYDIRDYRPVPVSLVNSVSAWRSQVVAFVRHAEATGLRPPSVEETTTGGDSQSSSGGIAWGRTGSTLAVVAAVAGLFWWARSRGKLSLGEGDDEIISHEESVRRRHAARREADRRERREQDKLRREIRRGSSKTSAMGPERARIARESKDYYGGNRMTDDEIKDSVFLRMKSGRKSKTYSREAHRGDRREIEHAQRLAVEAREDRAREAANMRIGYEIQLLRSLINKGKKTASRKAASRLRVTMSEADDGDKTELAARVLKIAKERGMA
jgi:hypothetical protein